MNPPKPYHEKHPWGEELWLTRDCSAPSMVKVITVMPGEALSLQYHRKRDEFWRAMSGDGWATVGNDRMPFRPGDTRFVPRETKHRIEGGTASFVFLELSFGEFDESDIVRLEDRYGRAVEKSP